MTEPILAKRVATWGLLGAVVLATGLVVGRSSPNDEPLHPASTGSLGAKAFVLLLEELGANVTVVRGTPTLDAEVAVVLNDTYDDAGRAGVLAWARAGRVLVVADPSSPLQPFPLAPPNLFAGDGTMAAGNCPIEALRDVEVLADLGSSRYDLFSGSTGCFESEGGYFLAVAPEGSGTVVALGGPSVFVNGQIGLEDNAMLAAALMAPTPGAEVAFLLPARAGNGEEGLVGLVGDNVKQAIWQLAVAFVLFALHRGRRLGPTVPEPQPVELAASELVVAVGNLLQRAGHRHQAADVLRHDLRRALASRLGLSPAAPAHEVAEVAATRTGLPVGRLIAVLEPGASVDDDADLVRLAGQIDALRSEVAR